MTDQFPREQYQTQAPIGATPASLAASIALGRLLRMTPYADLASIRFEIVDQGEGAYAGPGPYVVCTAAEPDECPSCHTIAGQHPHTEYCRRMAPSLIIDMPDDVTEEQLREFAERFSTIRSARPENHEYPGQPGDRLRTPTEWANLEDCLILDADGWRGRDAKPFDEPITQAEYERRRVASTCRFPASYNQVEIDRLAAKRAAEEGIGQVSQPATRTSQPDTQTRTGYDALRATGVHHTAAGYHPTRQCHPMVCGWPADESEPTPLATPTPHHGCTHTCDYPACQMQGQDCTGT
jgi:hypothetical protein